MRADRKPAHRRRTIATGRARRALAALLLAAMPAACAVPKPSVPANPFLGDWATADNDRITFRADTVVQDQKEGPPTALGPQTCAGVFRFAYGEKSREVLVGLVSDQPEVREQLRELLAAPSYPVVDLACDKGDQTYVLLGDRYMVAIYRIDAAAVIERYSRR